jgi:hypothetical protein
MVTAVIFGSEVSSSRSTIGGNGFHAGRKVLAPQRIVRLKPVASRAPRADGLRARAGTCLRGQSPA